MGVSVFFYNLEVKIVINNQNIYDLTQFVMQNKTNKDLFAIFNEWTSKYHIHIDNYQEAIWAINHIKMLQKMDESTIEEAQILDKKYIEKERIGALYGKTKKKAI